MDIANIIQTIAIYAIPVLFAITVHEAAHGYVARYFGDNIPGLWTDQFDASGKPLSTATPASCVYHLFLAFAEMLRLEPQIAKLP